MDLSKSYKKISSEEYKKMSVNVRKKAYCKNIQSVCRASGIILLLSIYSEQNGHFNS